MANNDGFEFISVSEAAKRYGVSNQTIYNRIRGGLYETIDFERGCYKGILVKCPVEVYQKQ